MMLLGTVLFGQWQLADVYFGEDYINWGISLGLVLMMLIKSPPFIKNKWFAFPVFLLLSYFSYSISFHLHHFPNWSTAGDYLLLVVITGLLIGALKKSKTQLWQQTILLFIGIGLGYWVGAQEVLLFLIIVAVALKIILLLVVDRLEQYWIQVVILLLLVFIVLNRDKQTVYASQNKYFDPVIFSTATAFQQIDITRWKGQLWYYLDRKVHFSTIDPWLYYEPLVHPALSLIPSPQNILIIGGENGLAVKEVLKNKNIQSIDLMPLDTSFLNLAQQHPLFLEVNDNVLSSDRINYLEADIFHYLSQAKGQYELLIVDLPDPNDILTNQYYTKEFYHLCWESLTQNGMMVSQSGSPYFATMAFGLINNTMQSAGFNTLQFHNQVMTAGEWGWTIGSKSSQSIATILRTKTFENMSLHWLNSEAMQMMLSFGKKQIMEESELINTLENPILYKSFNSGNWQHH